MRNYSRTYVRIWVAISAMVFATAALVTGCGDKPGKSVKKPNPAASSHSVLTSKQRDQLKSFVANSVKTDEFPGMALAVVSNRRVVFFDNGGFRDIKTKQPVTENTLFHLGSVTKSMTAVAVLQLRDAGKLKLSDSVTKYLPWFKVSGPFPSSDITIYDLLTQSSGIPATAEDTVYSIVLKSGKSSTTIEDGVKALALVKLSSKPGTEYAYSNLNYAILGLLVQTLSGESYEQYMFQHIFTPLDMTHTVFHASKQSNQATMYKVQRYYGPQSVQPPGKIFGYDEPAGVSLQSNVNDMAKYLSFELGDYGHAVLNKHSLLESHSHGFPAPGLGTYAYGWIATRSPNGTPYYWHNGMLEGAFAMVILYPSYNLGVVEFVNDGVNDVPYNLGLQTITSVIQNNNG